MTLGTMLIVTGTTVFGVVVLPAIAPPAAARLMRTATLATFGFDVTVLSFPGPDRLGETSFF